jgi:two-component system chemotaxis response regulator CheY
MRHVLIVEEDPFLAELAALKLLGAGHEVATLADGAAVLPYLGRESVDLILLDLNLPNVDGMTLLREIRLNPRTAKLPVLVFTNDDSDEVKAAIMEAKGRYFPKATTGTDGLLTAVEASFL